MQRLRNVLTIANLMTAAVLAGGCEQSAVAPDAGLGDQASAPDGTGTSPSTPTTPGTTPNPKPPVTGNCELGHLGSLRGRVPFPADNPWNQDISALPVDPNSDNYIASMGRDTKIHPDFGTTWEGRPIGIPYVVVSGSQPKVPMTFDYSSESDPGPYPIPADAPIEGGPTSTGDRHVLVVDCDNGKLYETYSSYQNGSGWHAASGAIFDMNSNALRPAGWTSADAAGLPIFPGLVRYDEVEAGEIRHALRFTVRNTQRAYVSPARHWASSSTNLNHPPMGTRVRLKASFNISGFTPRVQVILRAMKKYGMFVADNGYDWMVSGAHNPKWNDNELHQLWQVKGADFEVVRMGTIVR